jgi:hypothetical protein
VIVAFAVVRMSVSSPKLGGPPLVTPVTRSKWLGVAMLPLLGSSERLYTNRPARAFKRVRDEKVCVRSPNVTASTEAFGRRVASNGVTDVGRSGFTQCSSCTLCINCVPGFSRHVSLVKILFC